MPSEHQPAGKQTRARFPKLRHDIGEDPARWLDTHLVESGSKHTDTTELRMVLARIHGIDDLAVARAWRAIERRLDRGPRDKIIHLLEQRIDELDANGERELPGLSPEQQRERAVEAFEAVEKGDVVYRGPDGEVTSRTTGTSAEQKLAAMADGGEDA